MSPVRLLAPQALLARFGVYGIRVWKLERTVVVGGALRGPEEGTVRIFDIPDCHKAVR